jgi:hypothetical protein
MNEVLSSCGRFLISVERQWGARIHRERCFWTYEVTIEQPHFEKHSGRAFGRRHARRKVEAVLAAHRADTIAVRSAESRAPE